MRAPTACISPSGRRMRGASRWSAISTTGTAAATSCASAATPASGRSSSPTSAPGAALQIRDHRRQTAQLLPLKADPFAFASELRPKTASVVAEPGRLRLERRRAISTRAAKRDPRRSPISIYEVHLGSWRRRADGGFLSYDELADQLDPLCRRHRLHPSRAPADHRASARRLLGLPADRPVRADRALRRSGRLRPLRRPRPPGRHRHHPRLGAGAFPDRRARPRAASTAPRSTSTPIRAAASTPTGTRRSTISAAREVAAFLDQQRALLARALPRRRPPRRCRRLDALSRLFAQGRRLAAEPVWRQRERRGGRLPAADERRRLRQASRHHDHRRGIDRLARRLAAGLRRRPRLRLQVEHGLHARHAAATCRAIRSTASTTTTT